MEAKTINLLQVQNIHRCHGFIVIPQKPSGSGSVEPINFLPRKAPSFISMPSSFVPAQCISQMRTAFRVHNLY
jgi:hypothetical protein